MAKAANKRGSVKSESPLDPEGPGLITAILSMSKRKLLKHWDKIASFRDEAENKKVVVTIKATVDYSKSDPQLDVGIRYSQAVTDSSKATMTDPRQGKFTEIEAATEPGDPVKEPGEEEDPEKEKAKD